PFVVLHAEQFNAYTGCRRALPGIEDMRGKFTHGRALLRGCKKLLTIYVDDFHGQANNCQDAIVSPAPFPVIRVCPGCLMLQLPTSHACPPEAPPVSALLEGAE